MAGIAVALVLLVTTFAGYMIGIHIDPGYPVVGAICGFILGAAMLTMGGPGAVAEGICDAFDD